MKTLIYILAFAIVSFAADCANLYNRMLKTLETQTTTICRVTGIGEDREDIMGFFFNFTDNGKTIPAVFIYGHDYDEMLYAGGDWVVQNAKCINNGEYRSIKTRMQPEQILNKLFSYKKCEDGFNDKHEPSTGKIYL